MEHGTRKVVRVAYLVNQYPAPSHSFIRREIQAVERSGVAVERFSIRSAPRTLPDPHDVEELGKTKTIASAGAAQILSCFVWAVLLRPLRFLGALRMAIGLSRRSDRSLFVHLAYLVEACVLARWMVTSRIPHVHAHFATNPAAVAMLGAHLAACQYSFTIHGPTDFDLAVTLGLDVKIARAAFVAAISEFCRSQVCRWCTYDDWRRIHVVRCGLDKEFLGYPETPLPDAPAFVSVGRLSAAKGQLLLLEAMAALLAEGREVNLVLVGDGELRGALQERAASLGIEANVQFVGVASGAEVRKRILRSRAMVLPSFAEGLPVVLMESLALHRPVIATRIAGVPELVEDGLNGWVVTAGSVDELTTAMREVLETPVSRLREMGRAGAATVARSHDADMEGAKLGELFRRSSKRGRSTPDLRAGASRNRA